MKNVKVDIDTNSERQRQTLREIHSRGPLRRWPGENGKIVPFIRKYPGEYALRIIVRFPDRNRWIEVEKAVSEELAEQVVSLITGTNETNEARWKRAMGR